MKYHLQKQIEVQGLDLVKKLVLLRQKMFLHLGNMIKKAILIKNEEVIVLLQDQNQGEFLKILSEVRLDQVFTMQMRKSLIKLYLTVLVNHPT
jgi:hypothetical protein